MVNNEKSNTPRRWFTAISMVFSEVPEFWQRDAGLVCMGFRTLGTDARFVALGTPAVREDLPLVLATAEQMRDAAWWRQWGVEGVVLWGWPPEASVRAIKSSGIKVVFHLDSDGLHSPRVDFRRFVVRCRHEFKDAGRMLPALGALAKAVLFRVFASAYDARMTRLCEQADLLAVNSPIALQRFRRVLLGFGREDIAGRLRLIPSPVTPEACHEPAVAKKLQIVAAGRWQAYQKDAPKLMRVLGRALSCEPDYSAVLFGSGTEYLQRLRADLPAGVRSRIQIPGYVTRAALLRTYQESQILLLSSRYESLHLPSVEALCCGCSVVSPAGIPPTCYMAGASSGTVAMSQSAPDLADALCAEIEAWRQGERDPQSISHHWRDRFLPARFAEAVLRYFDPAPAAAKAACKV